MDGDIHKIIPNIDSTHDLSMVPRPRILKTHSPFNKVFKKVIYLLRNGGDSVLSYYKFLKTEEGYSGSFTDFLRTDKSKCYGVRWHEHVNSWLSNDYPNDMLLIKYEDLKNNFAMNSTNFKFLWLEYQRRKNG